MSQPGGRGGRGPVQILSSGRGGRGPQQQQQQPGRGPPPQHQQQQRQPYANNNNNNNQRNNNQRNNNNNNRQYQDQRQNNNNQGRGPAVHTQSGVPFGYVPGYLPGSASLVEELDKRLLIVLRDGKHILGTMVSYDQFSNMILNDAVERRVVVANGICHYSDIPLGLYIVRGDSVVLLGQVDAMREEQVMKEVSLEELEEIREQSGKEATTWDFDSDLVA